MACYRIVKEKDSLIVALITKNICLCVCGGGGGGGEYKGKIAAPPGGGGGGGGYSVHECRYQLWDFPPSIFGI